jgi:uncharacterized protein (TIGR01777 family)
MKIVLISGGTGLVGRTLSARLHSLGYEVRILSRKKFTSDKYKSFYWIPEEKYIEPEAFTNLDYIVHLAGENLGARRWSKKQKQKILDSRVKTSELLFEKVRALKVNLKAFVSASAIGIYPTFSQSEEYYIEKDMYGTGFTAQVCIAWEKAADNFKNAGIRTVKIRTGLVQDKKDSALAKILMLSKFGILPVFGRGKQYYPWIHIDDLVNIYVAAIENENFEDPFNAVAPDFVTNEQYVQTLKSVLGKRIVFHIPAFVIKLLFGEMSEIILRGTKIHSKLHSDGFEFKYPELKSALSSLLK